MNEFAINWIKGADYAEVTVPSGTALKSKLLKYAEKRPEEVNHVIVNKDGSMVCHVPVSFIKVSPPRKVSDKQRETARERFVKMWAENRNLVSQRKFRKILWKSFWKKKFRNRYTLLIYERIFHITIGKS